MNKKILYYIAVVAMLSSASTANRLRDIEIIGSAPDSLARIPGTAVVIDEATLDRTQPLTPAEALEIVPGISVRNEDGLGLRPSISIRGINGVRSRKVLMLEDGLPISLAPYGENSAYYVPQMARISRIEVLKGSGSILYGPQTIGGVLNFITQGPPERERTELTLQQSSYNNNLANLNYGNRWGRSALVVNALHRSGDGFRDMPFVINDLTANYTYDTKSGNRLSVAVQQYNEVSNSSYLGLTESMFQDNPLQNPAQDDWLYVERTSARVGYERFTDDALHKTAVYAYKTRRYWWRQDYEREDANTAYNSAEHIRTAGQVGSRILFKNSNGGRNRDYDVVGLEHRVDYDNATVGARLHYEAENNKRINGTAFDARSGVLDDHERRSTTAIAAFGQYRYALTDTITLVPGLRIEQYEQERLVLLRDEAVINKKRTTDNVAVIPGIGFTAQASESTQFFGGVHRGFAPPAFSVAIDNNLVDQELDAETSWNYEAGIRSQVDRTLSVSSTVFFTDYTNQIVPASEASGQTSTNAGQSQSLGVELDVIKLLAENDYFTVSSQTSVMLQNAVYTSDLAGEYESGNRIPYTPEAQYRIGLTLADRSGLSVDFDCVYKGMMYSDGLNTSTTGASGQTGIIPAHTVYDLTIRKVLSEQLLITGAIKNLFDLAYIASRDPEGIMPGNGRLIQLGATYTF